MTHARSRRRLAGAATITAVTLTSALAGCTNGAPSSAAGGGDESTPAAVIEAIEPAPDDGTQVADTPTPEPQALPKKTCTYTTKSAGGYAQTITITLGPVVSSDEQSVIDTEWASVGGEVPGGYPCIDVNPSNDMVTNYVMKSETAGFAFGTVQITNDVPGFDAAKVSYQFTRGGSSAMGLAFGDGNECDGLNTGGYLFTPSTFDDTWGPVPVVVLIDNYRSPEHPDGDASLLDTPLTLLWTDLTIPLVAWQP